MKQVPGKSSIEVSAPGMGCQAIRARCNEQLTDKDPS
jgi:hypothetical protein